ncbi:MAG: ATP-binding cassette domain-containing protein, partial [Acidobacteriota bacterium]|nr:ATP-binding cassette domain-containing protein [Acidobacteriota bacterium]
MKESLESEVRSPESEDRARTRRSESERAPSELASDSRLQTPDSGLFVEGVRKAFPDPSGGTLEVLRGVSFALRAGEMAAVVGASGAGKTTLLHVLGGLEAADAGRVRLGEFEVVGARASELARWRGREVGFVFQSSRLLADLSAEENVALPLLVARRGWREARVAARELLGAVGRDVPRGDERHPRRPVARLVEAHDVIARHRLDV